jgi:SAM-dependent methyltransferase
MLLVQDMGSGLVYNKSFDAAQMHYDADYQNEQGHSAAFRAHLDSMAALVQRHFGERTLIEVGCGKGLFLEKLRALGFRITGLDPTYEGDNPDIRRDYFSSALGLHADGLILRHVLEHVPDPVGFLTQLRDANGGSGRIYIEVPCLDWIARNHAWFDVFYEHVNYFRLSDFHRLFGQVHEAGRGFGGQYLYVVAELSSLRDPSARPAERFDLPIEFMASVTRSAEQLLALRREGRRRAAVWGGASKGVIFSLFMERAGADVDTVIDMNPAKQGRYLAATGLYVQAPEEALAQLRPGDDIYVMNRNYLAEIQLLTARQFNYITVEHEQL